MGLRHLSFRSHENTKKSFSPHHVQPPLVTPSWNYQVPNYSRVSWQQPSGRFATRCELVPLAVEQDSLATLKQWLSTSLEHQDWKHNLKAAVEVNHMQKRHRKKKYQRHRRTSMCRNIKHWTLQFRKAITEEGELGPLILRRWKEVSCSFSSYNTTIRSGTELKITKRKHFFT